MGTSTTHVVCRHQMRIFNTSFAYLFWLANNKKSNIQSSVWATLMKLCMWVVMGTSTTHVVCRHQMRILNTSFAAYPFWLANNKQFKYNLQGTSWHFPKGGPRCIFCEYSERVSREPRNSSFIWILCVFLLFVFSCSPTELAKIKSLQKFYFHNILGIPADNTKNSLWITKSRSQHNDSLATCFFFYLFIYFFKAEEEAIRRRWKKINYADSSTDMKGLPLPQTQTETAGGVRDDWMTGTPLEGALLERFVKNS